MTKLYAGRHVVSALGVSDDLEGHDRLAGGEEVEDLSEAAVGDGAYSQGFIHLARPCRDVTDSHCSFGRFQLPYCFRPLALLDLEDCHLELSCLRLALNENQGC